MVAADVMENTVMEVTNRIQADNIDNIAILFRLQIKQNQSLSGYAKDSRPKFMRRFWENLSQ